MTAPLDTIFDAALRRELVALPSTAPRRNRRRVVAISTATVMAVVGVGAVAVAALLPAGEIADKPLSDPYIVSGVGSMTVPLPPAPDGATYALVSLTCFEGKACMTPAGGTSDSPGTLPIDGDGMLPLTDTPDDANIQQLDPIEPTSGIPVTVDGSSHWRLYVVYTDTIDPKLAVTTDGKVLGMRGLNIPALVPVVMTSGQIGWVDYDQLTIGADVTFTSTGVTQAPLTAYGPDGETPAGAANVSGN